MFAFDLPA